MSKSQINWRCFGVLLLLLVLLQPIVSTKLQKLLNRGTRSAHTNTEQYTPDNNEYNSYLENTNPNRYRRPQQSYEATRNAENTNINDTLLQIFKFGNEKGVILFNRHTPEAQSPRRPTSTVRYPEYRNQTLKGPCNGKTYCTKVENYPDLSNLNFILKSQFAEGLTFISEDTLAPQDLANRINLESDEEDLCKAKESIIYPEKALGIDSNWYTILNDNKNFKQAIRVEECENLRDGQERPCDLAGGALPTGYKAFCKQNYVYRSVMALNKENDAPINQQIKVPSCCKCVIKRVSSN